MIAQNVQELVERMGAETSCSEAEAMAVILKARGVFSFEQLNAMSDSEFFSLIPRAIKAVQS